MGFSSLNFNYHFKEFCSWFRLAVHEAPFPQLFIKLDNKGYWWTKSKTLNYRRLSTYYTGSFHSEEPGWLFNARRPQILSNELEVSHTMASYLSCQWQNSIPVTCHTSNCKTYSEDEEQGSTVSLSLGQWDKASWDMLNGQTESLTVLGLFRKLGNETYCEKIQIMNRRHLKYSLHLALYWEWNPGFYFKLSH